ncbi:hypothetical protein [uncultured Robinsoniella sp.]
MEMAEMNFQTPAGAVKILFHMVPPVWYFL